MRLLAEKMCPRRSVARAGGKVKGSVFNDFLLTGLLKISKKRACEPGKDLYLKFLLKIEF